MIHERGRARVNDMLVMQHCKTTKSIPQDPFPYNKWDILLSEAE